MLRVRSAVALNHQLEQESTAFAMRRPSHPSARPSYVECSACIVGRFSDATERFAGQRQMDQKSSASSEHGLAS